MLANAPAKRPHLPLLTACLSTTMARPVRLAVHIHLHCSDVCQILLAIEPNQLTSKSICDFILLTMTPDIKGPSTCAVLLLTLHQRFLIACLPPHLLVFSNILRHDYLAFGPSPQTQPFLSRTFLSTATRRGSASATASRSSPLSLLSSPLRLLALQISVIEHHQPQSSSSTSQGLGFNHSIQTPRRLISPHPSLRPSSR